MATADDEAAAALAEAVESTDGDPECVRCSNPADYFLFEDDRVAKFVCWEHVSPHSAAVEDDEEVPPGRPIAVSL